MYKLGGNVYITHLLESSLELGQSVSPWLAQRSWKEERTQCLAVQFLHLNRNTSIAFPKNLIRLNIRFLNQDVAQKQRMYSDSKTRLNPTLLKHEIKHNQPGAIHLFVSGQHSSEIFSSWKRSFDLSIVSASNFQSALPTGKGL